MVASPTASGRPTLAAFSVDVEDYFQVEALRPFCPRERWESFESRVERNTERVMEILERHDARGTFFVLGWIAERHPGLIRRISANGHEVASHGSAHELIYNQAPDAFRDDVKRARALLQDLSGQQVIGYRAPSYTIMTRTLWALRVLAEEGYRYDSSIFPIARRRYGMPGARRWPHRIELDAAHEVPGGGSAGDGGLPVNDTRTPGSGAGRTHAGAIAEFPLPTIKLGPLNFPATGGAYLRLLPLAMQRLALQRMIRSGRPFVLNFHPWELDADQPPFPVGRRTRWTHYHNLERAAGRLDALLSLARYRSQGAVLRRLGLI